MENRIQTPDLRQFFRLAIGRIAGQKMSLQKIFGVGAPVVITQWTGHIDRSPHASLTPGGE